MSWKKYQSIVRHGKTATQETVKDGSFVVVWEKLDGANASFMLSEDGTEILCFSRNGQLSSGKNGLRGFYEWVQENVSVNRIKKGRIYYGEWLVRHKIDYGENEKNFYLFDIFNNELGEFVDYHTLVTDGVWLDLSIAPVLAKGIMGQDFTFEDIQSLAGKSTLAVIAKGEGVVIKNYSHKYRDGSQMFTKIVTKEFQESNGVKSPKNSSSKPDALTEFINNNLTEARVEKLIHKLVDTGQLCEDYNITDMGTILKGLGSSVADDILNEELDGLIKVVKGRVGRAVPNIVKKVLENNSKNS